MSALGRAHGLLDIGYHFIIDRDGAILETRLRYVQGSHSPGYNHDSIGIALAGGRAEDGETPEDNFTTLQLMALADLTEELMVEFGTGLKLYAKTELRRYRDRPVPTPMIDMVWLRREWLPTFNTEKNLMSAPGLPEGATKLTETSQSIVLKYLQEGRTLTQQVALACLGVGSLTSRIAELRRLGHVIVGDWRIDRYNRRYKAYKLADDQGEHAEAPDFDTAEG